MKRLTLMLFLLIANGCATKQLAHKSQGGVSIYYPPQATSNNAFIRIKHKVAGVSGEGVSITDVTENFNMSETRDFRHVAGSTAQIRLQKIDRTYLLAIFFSQAGFFDPSARTVSWGKPGRHRFNVVVFNGANGRPVHFNEVSIEIK